MSGGSFNYACFKVTDTREVFSAMDDIEHIEKYLRSINRHSAADEVFRYYQDLKTISRHLAIMGERLEPLLYATEWCASGDWNEDGIDAAYQKLIGLADDKPQPPEPTPAENPPGSTHL